MVVQNQSQLGEGSAITTDPHHIPTFIQPSTQPQKTQQPRKPKRKDTQVPQPSDPIENVADEAVQKELGESLVRAATTASSLEAEQNSGNINKTQSKVIPNESSSLGTTLGGGPWCQETMGILLIKLGLRMYLNILMIQCSVLDLEKTKTTQHNEIVSLKRKVKKLKKKNRSKTHRLKRLYKVGLTARVESSDNEESLGKDASKQERIDAIDADEEITLENDEVNVVEEVVEVINTAKLFTDAAQVSAASIVVSTAGDATTVTTATTTTNDDGDITLAQALIKIKSTKPKVKWVVIQELGESTTTISSQLSSQQTQDKGKGILIEHVKPMKKKNQIRFNEKTTLNLQAEFDEEERLAREKAEKEEEANKKATFFQQLLDKRRKHFAAKRAEEKRNKPPTKAQQRKILCTYLKNMEGYKLKDLKYKEFDYIQEMFNRSFKWVNIFEDFRTELVEGKEKRVGTKLIQENAKKQKVEDDKETSELKQCLEIIPDEEEVTIYAIPLAVKSPSIVDWKIYKEGRIGAII
ncbi:hypothetical protein Tco_0277796 [Tanacetum coccineum]